MVLTLGAVALFLWWRRDTPDLVDAPPGDGTAARDAHGARSSAADAAGRHKEVSLAQVLASRADAQEVHSPNGPIAKPEGWDDVPTSVELDAKYGEGLRAAYLVGQARARVAAMDRKWRACARKLPRDHYVEYESVIHFEPRGDGTAIATRERIHRRLDPEPEYDAFFDCARDVSVGMVLRFPTGVPAQAFDIREQTNVASALEYPIPADDLREMWEELAELREWITQNPPEHKRILMEATIRRLSCILEQKKRPDDCE